MRLRPHHFLCLMAFSGKGYSPEFIDKMTSLQQRFWGGEIVVVTFGADDACLTCPHFNSPNQCKSEPRGVSPETLDGRALVMLDMNYGEGKYIQDILDVLKHIDSSELEIVCDSCSWKENAQCIRTIMQNVERLSKTETSKS